MMIGQYKSSQLQSLGLSILDRYILVELTLPFLFGMGLFSSLGVSVGSLFELVRQITESGLLLGVAIKILALKMPEFIVLAFPMSILLAGIMGYGRLSSDSEIIALRSIGIGIYRLILPGIIFSLLITGLTFFFNDLITPSATYEATMTLRKALGDKTSIYRDRNIIYPEYAKKENKKGVKEEVLVRFFYAEEFDGTQMNNLTIFDRSQKDVNQIINAESATWNINDNRWDFFDGTVYVISPDGKYQSIVKFDHQQVDLPDTPLKKIKNKTCKDYNEMSLAQSYKCLEELKDDGSEKKIRKLEVRIQEKIALPFICLVMGIVGAAIGMRPQNAGKATSLGICVLIVFFYYLLAFICSSLGVIGVLSPIVSAWSPNAIGLVAGGWLLSQSAK